MLPAELLFLSATLFYDVKAITTNTVAIGSRFNDMIDCYQHVNNCKTIRRKQLSEIEREKTIASIRYNDFLQPGFLVKFSTYSIVFCFFLSHS